MDSIFKVSHMLITYIHEFTDKYSLNLNTTVFIFSRKRVLFEKVTQVTKAFFFF
ncbi:hypothetical protein BD770DRAFT_397915 [Pilaira anomala]|nr:hypothetical protein BD770DRAFT_397915 [Pilaira anomala]